MKDYSQIGLAYFENFNPTGWYCLDFEQNDVIYGDYTTPNSWSIIININYCISEPNCHTLEELTAKLNEYKMIGYLLGNNVINANDYQKPF